MRARSRHSTIVRVTVGYLLAWAAGVVIWLIAVAVMLVADSNGGPEFNWLAFGLVVLGAFIRLVAGHVVWTVGTTRMLRPYGRPWRTALTVAAPPGALVLLTVAVNESLLPWQLWPVVAVAVPAACATWATDPHR